MVAAGAISINFFIGIQLLIRSQTLRVCSSRSKSLVTLLEEMKAVTCIQVLLSTYGSLLSYQHCSISSRYLFITLFARLCSLIQPFLSTFSSSKARLINYAAFYPLTAYGRSR